MVEEARLEQRDAGLTPVTDGWFVVNVRDGAKLALCHGAGVERETAEACASFPEWRLGPPADWSGLPWAIGESG